MKAIRAEKSMNFLVRRKYRKNHARIVLSKSVHGYLLSYTVCRRRDINRRKNVPAARLPSLFEGKRVAAGAIYIQKL